MVEKLKENKTKVKEIEVFTNSNSKIEEIIVPKSKTDIEPLSDDEEEYLNYLINRYVTNEQTPLVS